MWSTHCLTQIFRFQGRDQDFFRGTRNSLCTPPPPPKKKNFLDYKFGNVVSLRVFSAYEITLATSEILVAFLGELTDAHQ